MGGSSSTLGLGCGKRKNSPDEEEEFDVVFFGLKSENFSDKQTLVRTNAGGGADENKYSNGNTVDLPSSFAFESAIIPGFDPESPDVYKECQDDCLVHQRFCEVENDTLMCLFDGHGDSGRKTAEWLVANYPRILLQHHMTNENPLDKALTTSFRSSQALLTRAGFNVKLSGSTATVCVIKDEVLHFAWVGDSRAVLACKDAQTGKVFAKPMTKDHKPDDPVELERIESKGGVVKKVEGGEHLPPRVFSKVGYMGGNMSPGIAMSRSLGDMVANSLGVIDTPDILTHTIDYMVDKFLILASDGIWEVFTDDEAVKWVNAYVTKNSNKFSVLPGHMSNNANMACLALAREAQRRWMTKYQKQVVIDDASVIICWLNRSGLDASSVPLRVDRRDMPAPDRLPSLDSSGELLPVLSINQISYT